MPAFRRSRRRYLFALSIIIACFLAGCGFTLAPTSENDNGRSLQTTPTATPPPLGLSRENPLNGLEPISLKNWELHVLDIVRGPEAWKRIHDANPFNDPPPDGWSYILIRYQLQRKGNDQAENSLAMHMTGSANILYYSFNNSAVPPGPVLDSYLLGGESSEGWEVYLVRDDESDLTVVLDDLSDYEEPEYFARLAEDAALTVPASLADIAATSIGREPDDLLPFGQIATSEDWQIALHEVVQGEEAWGRVQTANQFNDPPADGQMYLLIKVWVRYIGANSLGEVISNTDFELMNADKQVFPVAAVSGLASGFSFLKLYPGGEFEGWLAFAVNKGDESLILLFDADYSGSENRRYLSLRKNGR